MLLIFEKSLDDLEKLEGATSEAVVFYQRCTKLLSHALLTRRWPKVFLQNPFACQKEDLPLEREFYFEYQKLLQAKLLDLSIATLEPFCLDIFAKLEQYGADTSAAKAIFSDIRTFLQTVQNRIRSYPLTLEHFESEAEPFWDEVAEISLRFEAFAQQVMLCCYDITQLRPEIIQEFARLLNFMKFYSNLLKIDILSPGKSIKAYLGLRKCISSEEAEKKKAERISPKRPQFRPRVIRREAPIAREAAAEPSAAQPSVAALEIPQALGAQHELFEKAVSCLAHLCLNLIPSSNDPKTVNLTAIQHNSAFHLQESLPAFRELLNSLTRYGHRPFYIRALYLKLSVALEQAGLLVLSNLNVYQEPKDVEHALLKKMGHACFWQLHNPFNLAQELEKEHLRKKKPLPFEPAQRQFLRQIGRVIAITSRQPASGNDPLSMELEQALRDPHQNERAKKAEAVLQIGFTTLLNFVKPILPSQLEGQSPAPLAQDSIQKALGLLDFANRPHPIEADNLIETFQDRIQRLRAFNAFPLNRFVPAIWMSMRKSCKST